MFLVPAMAHLLLDHPGFETVDLSSVSICSVGSAPLAPFVVERLQERMPDALVSNNYGMTEAGSAYATMPKGEAVKHPGSVGKIAPPALVRIVDADDQPVPANEVGEVRMQLPGTPAGVLRRPGGNGGDVEGRVDRHGRPRDASTTRATCTSSVGART